MFLFPNSEFLSAYKSAETTEDRSAILEIAADYHEDRGDHADAASLRGEPVAPRREFRAVSYSVQAFAVCPTSNVIAIHQNGDILFCCPQTERVSFKVSSTLRWVSEMRYSPDGDTIALSGPENILRVLNVGPKVVRPADMRAKTIRRTDNNTKQNFALSRDNAIFYKKSGNVHGLRQSDDHWVPLLKPCDRNHGQTIVNTEIGAITANHDGSRVAFSIKSEGENLITLLSRNEDSFDQIKRKSISMSLDFHPTANALAIGSTTNCVDVWNFSDEASATETVLSKRLDSFSHIVKFSPCGNFLAVGEVLKQGRVLVLDSVSLDTIAIINQIKQKNSFQPPIISDIQWSRDSSTIWILYMTGQLFEY